MNSSSKSMAAVVVPIGPGIVTALDTLESVARYCPEPHLVVIVDDCTQDGTYQALLNAQKPNWKILRNERSFGIDRLVHTLCAGYRFVLSETACDVILRLDQDALLIGDGVFTDARAYMKAQPRAGLFGVYAHDYNRPRSFTSHEKQMKRELGWWRRLAGMKPYWAGMLAAAEARGYRRGDNVFGGAYFLTRECLRAMNEIGALNVPYNWSSRLMEDVYFSMATVAAGLDLSHFGAPEGPICLEWRGLPYPANELVQSGYKVVHSVDKGKNTDRASNGGKTAREFFAALRNAAPSATSLEPVLESVK
jgi:glycosyltransferase involved in cell wall biosynthesis